MNVDWVTVVVSVAINTPAVGGLLRWLGKRRLQEEMVQHSKALEELKAGYIKELEKYKDELDKSKRLLQAEIDKTVLVTRVHFETEFEALKVVFGKLAELKLHMSSLRPSVRIGPADEPPEYQEKRLAQAMQTFHTAYDGLLTVTEQMSAFYPKDIYDQLRQCLKVANMEDTDLKLSGTDTFSSEWYGRGSINMQEFLASFNNVSDLIRERISKLAVVRVA